MYNGIGLTTVRGSATSGHVSKNLSYIKPEFFRNKLDANLNGGRQGERNKGGESFKVNKDVLEHNRKHALEAQVFEYEDSLREKGGYTEEEIESKTADFRLNLSQRQTGNSTRNASGSSRTGRATDTHEISARKNEENERLRSAFGIGKDFVSGASFDPVVQEQRRKERESQKSARFEQNKIDRERREIEQAERRRIQDQRRDGEGDRGDTRRGEKRGRDDSRERRRDSRDRNSRDDGRGRSRFERRSRSRDRRDNSGSIRRDDINRSRSPVKIPVVSNQDVAEEEGEIHSPPSQERSSRSPSPSGSRRVRSSSRDKRGRSPVPRRGSKRRDRSQSSSSSSSSSSSGSSSSNSSRSSRSSSSNSSGGRRRGSSGNRGGRRSRSRSGSK